MHISPWNDGPGVVISLKDGLPRGRTAHWFVMDSNLLGEFTGTSTSLCGFKGVVIFPVQEEPACKKCWRCLTKAEAHTSIAEWTERKNYLDTGR